MNNRRTLLVALCLAVAPLSNGMAETPLEIPFEEYRLDNGLQVLLHQDPSTPIAHVEVWFHVGSKDEVQGRSGFAHLFEHLMFNGSEHADGEFFAPLQPYGARMNGTTNTDRTNYYETVPSHVLERALWMEADRMGFLLPALTIEKLDNQRDVVRNERRQNYEIRPYAKSRKAINEAIWPEGHPYHHLTIGTHEDLAAASLDDVKTFFNTWYVPNNATLVVSGAFDPDQTKGWIERYFGPIPKGPDASPIMQAEAPLPAAVTVELTDNVQLPRLYQVWRSSPFFEPGDAELDYLSLILTSGKNSRLYKRLVFEDRIAKDVSAGQYSSQLGSTYNIVATAAPGHTLEEIEQAIDEELARFLAEGPTPEEVERVRNAWQKSFFQRLEGVQGRGGMLQMYNQYRGDAGYVSKDLQRYLDVTAESITEWAGKTLVPDHRVRVVVNPKPKDDDAAKGAE
jgi:zinc protease